MSCEDNFADYVNKVVGNLQLINIQDACIGVAVSLYHEYDIPDGILTKTQLKALNYLLKKAVNKKLRNKKKF